MVPTWQENAEVVGVVVYYQQGEKVASVQITLTAPPPDQ